MKTHSTLTTAAVVMLASISSFAAVEQAYLPPQSAIDMLADGAPWSAQAPNGRNFQLTLNKDGTGSIRGPLRMTFSLTWTVKDEAVCITGTMVAKCLRFREIPGGYQSWDADNKPDLKLSRSP